MKIKTTLLYLLFIVLSIQADTFDDIKSKIASSDCNYYEFITVIESDIFDTVDSTTGTAILSSDGRYLITAADEQYRSDLKNIYTYSKTNNQVIIEKYDSLAADEILFITKLDEFYKSYILTPDLTYRLVKREKVEGDYPDSLLIQLTDQQIKQIEFYDINEELNRIIFIKQEYDYNCSDSTFLPDYPDSVEKVKL